MSVPATGADLPPLKPDFAALATKAPDASLIREIIDVPRERMPEAAAKIDELAWVKDGISSARELRAISNLLRLFEVGYGDSLIGEPWVVEGSNFPALAELRLLSWNTRPFERFIVHPAVVDGITEQEAKVLATLSTITNPDRLGPGGPQPF